MIKTLKNLLTSNTETEVLEFKHAKSQFDKNKLGKYFSALSNEANLKNQSQAWLLFGVDNDKKIVGTDISDKQLNDYKREISNHTSPTMGFINIHRVVTEDGDVLMCEIPPALKGMTVSWKGHYYGRDGESLGALNTEEQDRIRNQQVLEDWSAQIIPNASLDDLSVEAIFEARKQYIEKNTNLKKEIDKWNDVTFLNKAKITIKGKITNTAILLLGKSESEHLLSPAIAKMSWILKDRDNISKDYEHFSCPFLLNAPQLSNKIRNLKYRYIRDMSLFPDEVDSYDPYVVREALNNCIAHQDYTLGGKINVVEREDSKLIFLNKGCFIPKTIENVLTSDAPEPVYRNKFLTEAMVNLNMIDTIGSGIVKMFNVQRNRFFPLPEYSFDNDSVQVIIEGKILDMNYATKLANIPDLSLYEIILLDKVQKGNVLTLKEANILKNKKLIEGKRPNLHISSGVANVTGEKASYIKQRGFKDDHYKKMILEYIKQYGQASKKDIDNLILDILPNILDKDQRANKVRNLVYSMSKRDKNIINEGTTRYPKWQLSSSKR